MLSENNDRKVIEGSEKSQVSKMIFLMVIALALTSFPLLSMLAPAPVAFSFLLFGRTKGSMFAGVYAIGLIFLSFYYPKIFPLLGPMAIAMALVGYFLAEVILRRVPPKKGMVVGGLTICLGLGLIVGLATLATDFSVDKLVEAKVVEIVKEFKTSNKLEGLKAEGGEEARALLDIINNPKTLVKKIVTWLPAGIFVSTIFTLWACLYVILRNSLLWRGKVSYPYGLRDLLSFKVPDYFIWPLITALVLTLGGEYVLGDVGVIIGTNLLYAVGIFYFFQGFGVFVDFLDHFKIFGFFRTLLMAFTLFMAWRFLFLVGVFDLWINFRKFLKKKENK
ncbi:MAG: hypothetical protein DRQ88_04965 [Epsilonproteobacteria bacterium]|nr:MAG: hypothetical protein DRQ89_10760 [Campylobacterota bacterium]RLA66885.1 MAG: hypothetical protein DRQ88_04965 [Campylobacterota bacterium]